MPQPAKPTAIKRLEGNRNRTPLPENEPLPDLGTEPPAPPAHLGEIARTEWARLSRQLWLNGCLGAEDVQAFAVYCDAVEDFITASANLEAAREEEKAAKKAAAAFDALEHKAGQTRPWVSTGYGGAISVSANGNLQRSPLMGLKDDARKALLKAANEFGLTPVSRSRIDVPKVNPDRAKPKDAPKQAGEFLNRGPRSGTVVPLKA